MTAINPVINLPFEEQIAFFRQKVNLPTQKWTDVFAEAHDRAFMVAGAAKADLLTDLKAAVDKAIAEGKGIYEFRQDFDNIVAKQGWTGWTGESSKAGRDWRTRVIYDTNISTSYAAGRWQQLNDPDLLKLRPYWKYVHADGVRNPRPLHVSWNGLVLPANDKFWLTHFPPNGWFCHCRVTAVKASDYKGQQAPDDGFYTQVVNGETIAVPNGIDVGFNYASGASLTQKTASLIENKRVNYAPQLAQAVKADMKNLLLSTANSLLAPSTTMNIINLDNFAVVQQTMTELAAKNPHWFPQGFNGIHAVDRSDMFAGYDQGTFYFSNADDLVNGFKPASELAHAVQKASTGAELTFNEEYAVETLWHEIMHGITKISVGRYPLGSEPLAEGVVQLVARHSYNVLMVELGSLAAQQNNVIQNGLAYPQVTKNLNKLITEAGLSGFELANRLMSEQPNDWKLLLVTLLSEKMNLTQKSINGLLSKAEKLSSHDFAEKMTVKLRNARRNKDAF